MQNHRSAGSTDASTVAAARRANCHSCSGVRYHAIIHHSGSELRASHLAAQSVPAAVRRRMCARAPPYGSRKMHTIYTTMC